MASLSELNKQERKLRGEIVKLRREFREKRLSKKEFDEVFDSLSRDLEGISEQKSELIGLPPLPPKPREKPASSMPTPPRPSSRGKPSHEGRFGLDSIKKSILGGFRDDSPDLKGAGFASIPDAPPMDPKPGAGKRLAAVPAPPRVGKQALSRTVKARDLEPPPLAPAMPKDDSEKPYSGRAPPKPPARPKPSARKRPSKPKPPKEKVVRIETVKEMVEKVPVVTERIKRVEVPVIKEVIREVPVIKEVIREVKVPVVKVKKVPVIKEVKVPAEAPEMAKRIEESIKGLNELRVDMATSTQEISQLSRSLVDISKRVQGVENLKADVKALSSAMGKIDFQGLSQDIYSQFKTLKSFIDDSVKNGKDSSSQALSVKTEENTQDIRGIQSDFARVEKEVAGFLKEVRESVSKVQEMAGLKGEIEELDARIKNIDFEGLTQEIYKQFQKMDSDINQSERKINDFVEKIKVDIKTLEEKASEAAGAKEHVDSLDITSIRRDMESLKQKSQYIEKHIERVDLEPVMSLIRDVENKVETLRASSALIIE